MIDVTRIFLPFCTGVVPVSDTLPIAPGDFWRWLLPPGKGYGPGDVLRLVDSAGSETAVGSLRRGRGELYTDLVLSVGSVPTFYRQFALTVAGQPITTTFRPSGSYATQLDYVRAIARHLASQPLLAIDVWHSGNLIYGRLYDSDRLRIAGQTVAIGLGIVKERNPNSPSLTLLREAPVGQPATWPYSVSVGSSVVEGNIFRLDAVGYTAKVGDGMAEIRAGLGLAKDVTVPIYRSSATYPLATAQPGSVRTANTNTPGLYLAYSGSAGGNDTYTPQLTAPIVAGNIFQITVSGQATRNAVADSSSTPASIVAALTASTGTVIVPTSVVPVVMLSPGFQTSDNTNSPALMLTALTPIAAQNRVTVRGYIGRDVVAGNSYELSIGGVTTTYTARIGDNAQAVGLALGQVVSATGSFMLDLDPATLATGKARRGNLYRSPDHVAPVSISQQNRPLNGPWIAELTLPTSLPADTYKLRCGSAECPVRLRASRLSIIGPDTSVVSWGTGGVVLEDGLTQRLRLPLFLGASRSQQTESLYTDLSGLSRRNRATSRPMRTLTTTTQSAQFHRAMWAMLKSDSVSIDDKPYTQQGDYATSEGSPPNYRGQGRCTVLGLTQADTRPLWSNATGSESNSYAVVTSLNGPDNLTIWLRGYTFEGVVSAGLNLPVGEYELHVSVGRDALRLTIESGGTLSSYTLLPDRTNRLRNVRLIAGAAVWTLNALSVKLLTGNNVAAYGDPETVLSQTAQANANALRDFSTDYNADFK